jgi:hypothetical protein
VISQKLYFFVVGIIGFSLTRYVSTDHQICMLHRFSAHKHKKCKVTTVTGREGPYGCETSRLPYLSRQWAHRWR